MGARQERIHQVATEIVDVTNRSTLAVLHGLVNTGTAVHAEVSAIDDVIPYPNHRNSTAITLGSTGGLLLDGVVANISKAQRPAELVAAIALTATTLFGLRGVARSVNNPQTPIQR